MLISAGFIAQGFALDGQWKLVFGQWKVREISGNLFYPDGWQPWSFAKAVNMWFLCYPKIPIGLNIQLYPEVPLVFFSFHFCTVYRPDMPNRLPISDFVSGLVKNILRALKYWLHYTLVALAWLGVVPITACECRRFFKGNKIVYFSEAEKN